MGTSAKFLTYKADGNNDAAAYYWGVVDITLMNQEDLFIETFTVSYNDIKYSSLPAADAICKIIYKQMEAKFCGRVPFTEHDLLLRSLKNQRLQFAWTTWDGLWIVKLLQIDHVINNDGVDAKSFTFEFKRSIAPF